MVSAFKPSFTYITYIRCTRQDECPVQTVLRCWRVLWKCQPCWRRNLTTVIPSAIDSGHTKDVVSRCHQLYGDKTFRGSDWRKLTAELSLSPQWPLPVEWAWPQGPQVFGTIPNPPNPEKKERKKAKAWYALREQKKKVKLLDGVTNARGGGGVGRRWGEGEGSAQTRFPFSFTWYRFRFLQALRG